MNLLIIATPYQVKMSFEKEPDCYGYMNIYLCIYIHTYMYPYMSISQNIGLIYRALLQKRPTIESKDILTWYGVAMISRLLRIYIHTYMYPYTYCTYIHVYACIHCKWIYIHIHTYTFCLQGSPCPFSPCAIHNSFISMTKQFRECAMTYSSVECDLSTSITWLIHEYDMAHSYV